MNIEENNKVDQLKIYENFKKYCKYCSECVRDDGVRLLKIQDGHDQDYSMNVIYFPQSSGLSGLTDSLIVMGIACTTYSSVHQLLNIGFEMLGPDSFRTKEEVECINNSSNKVIDLSIKHK